MLAVIAGTFVGVGLLIAFAGASAAQTVPTVPCPGCGPGAPGDGTRAWSFTEFVCQPQRGFIIVFGVGRNVDEAVNFSVGTELASIPGPTPVRPVASGVQPGTSRQALLPEPAVGIVKVRVVGVGATSGRVLLDNTRELECICDQVTTTTPTTSPTTSPTSTPTSGPTTSPPTSSATSFPNSSEPTISPTSVTPFTLPSTGSNSTSIALGGLALVGVGVVALGAIALVRRPTADGEEG